MDVACWHPPDLSIHGFFFLAFIDDPAIVFSLSPSPSLGGGGDAVYKMVDLAVAKVRREEKISTVFLGEGNKTLSAAARKPLELFSQPRYLRPKSFYDHSFEGRRRGECPHAAASFALTVFSFLEDFRFFTGSAMLARGSIIV